MNSFEDMIKNYIGKTIRCDIGFDFVVKNISVSLQKAERLTIYFNSDRDYIFRTVELPVIYEK